jgi:magnesium transporter
VAVVARSPHVAGFSARVFRLGERPRVLDAEDWSAWRPEDGGLLWVDLQSPSDDDFSHVMRAFNIDPRAAATARTVKRRPLVRAFDNHHLVTLLSFQVDEAQHSPRIRVVEVDLLIGRNFILSLHKRPLPFAVELEERMASNALRGRSDTTPLLYLFLETLVAAYVRQLDLVERRVERLQLELLREPGRRALDDAIVLTRHVQTLRRLVSPHCEVVATLLAVEEAWLLPSAMETNFRDLLTQLRSLVDHLDHTRDMVTGGYTLYISNVSFRTNEQLKVLTVLSAILLPTTLITGLFGTNFKLAEYDSWQPFYVMLVGMGVIAWAMLLFFRWRRWL